MTRGSEGSLEKLRRAEQLMTDGKVDEARPLIEALEEVDDLPPDAQLIRQLLKSQLLIIAGHFKGSYQLVEQVLKESQKQGRFLQAVDACIIMAEACEWLDSHDESLNAIIQGEQILATLIEEPPTALAQRQASLIHLRARFCLYKGPLLATRTPRRSAWRPFSCDQNSCYSRAAFPRRTGCSPKQLRLLKISVSRSSPPGWPPNRPP